MEKFGLAAKDRDGADITLLPDEINLLGIGWDFFDKESATWPTLFENFFKDVKELPMEFKWADTAKKFIVGYRRFELKIPEYFTLDDEDRNRTLHASYYQNEDDNWVFRLDAYKELYEGTPAENWIDW